jgi:hypothetical protein
VRGSALSATEQECDDHYGTGLLARWAVRTTLGRTAPGRTAPGRTAPGRTGTGLLARWAVRQNRRALSADWGNRLAPSAAHGHNRVCTRFAWTANGTKLFLLRPWAHPPTSAPGPGSPLPHLRRDLLGLRVCLCKARMETYCGGGTSALTCGRLDQAGRTTSATGQHSHTLVL